MDIAGRGRGLRHALAPAKTRFTKSLGIATPWQRRYWEHTIRDERDLANHIDYIHITPVKHGYATRAVDWPHSSIHRFIADGVVNGDWAAEIADSAFGEPVATQAK